MIYEYACHNEKCLQKDVAVEIMKPVKDINVEELCQFCSAPMKRLFTSSNVNIGALQGAGKYNYQSRQMGVGKFDESGPALSDDKEIDYMYKCYKEDCEDFGKVITITKCVRDASKDEHCEKCKQKLGKVYDCSYRWGKGSRPDSDSWSEKLERASENNDREEHLRLMNHYDSTGRSYFVDENDKAGHKVKGKDFLKTFEYYCDNSECAGRGEVVEIEKLLSESGREERCGGCGSVLRRDWGLGGFEIK